MKTRLRYITGLVYEMRGIELFYGIPYATPPTAENDLRFELPRPNEESSNLTATRYVSGCTDGTFLEREDCLYLDVCRRAGTQPEDRKPVSHFPTHRSDGMVSTSKTFIFGADHAQSRGSSITKLRGPRFYRFSSSSGEAIRCGRAMASLS